MFFDDQALRARPTTGSLAVPGMEAERLTRKKMYQAPTLVIYGYAKDLTTPGPSIPRGKSPEAARVDGRVWMQALLVGSAVAVVGCAALQQGKAPLRPRPTRPVRYYRAEIIPVPDWGEPDRGPMDPTIAPYDPLTAAGSGDQIRAFFRGTERKLAKTSFADLQTERERTVDQLVTTLIADGAMLAHAPPITTAPSSDRVQEEDRSVKVRGWIYAIKYEDDQDWHLILGTDPAGGAKTYFSCDVSGLPAKGANAYASLLEVRQSLAFILDSDLPGPGSYTKYTPPIPVAIEGMLFFNVNHPAGAVGPTGMRPNTAWEVDPITKIELRPA